MTEANASGPSGLMLLLAFLGGALVGGAAAVLLAPRSGADTRRRIADAVGDTRGLASSMPNAIRQAASAAQAAFTTALKQSEKEVAAPLSPPAPVSQLLK